MLKRLVYDVTTFTNAILATGTDMSTWFLAKPELAKYIQYDFVLPFFEDFIDNFKMID